MFATTTHSPFLFQTFSIVDTPAETNEYIVVKVSPVWFNQTVIEWSVPEEWSGLRFNIYRSEIENTDYIKLNSIPFTDFSYTDTTAREFLKVNEAHYRIEVIFPDGRTLFSVSKDSDNVRTPWIDLKAKEVNRREWLYLRKLVGVKTLLFRRKTKGLRCPTCWSHAGEKILRDNCPTCFGTSWEGGYDSPIETLLQYDTSTNDVVPSVNGLLEPNRITAWTVGYPKFYDLDIIVRVPDNKVYRVDIVQPTELQTSIVRQILTLSELEKSAIEHKLRYR